MMRALILRRGCINPATDDVMPYHDVMQYKRGSCADSRISKEIDLLCILSG